MLADDGLIYIRSVHGSHLSHLQPNWFKPFGWKTRDNNEDKKNGDRNTENRGVLPYKWNQIFLLVV